MLISTAAQNASLANDYGANKGPNAASSLEVALFTDDPSLGGTELTSDGGYARVTVANDGTTWPDAPSAGSITSATVTFAAPTGAWSDTAKWFVLYDAADSTTAWDAQELTQEVDVLDAGPAVPIQMTVYYENLGA